MNFLHVNNVSHTYFSKDQAVTALDSISLGINKGEFISFLGPSGCGKTTLLSIIAGLLEPTSGGVLFEQGKASGQIGYMLQQDYLFPWKTIEENVTLGLKLAKHNKNDASVKAADLLSTVGLPGAGQQYPRQLSGGMRQRAALARTLATDPDILLLDEPFSALDYQTKLKLEDLVSEKLKSFGKTAVLVTHDIGESIAMSDRIYLFAAKPGRIHQIFTVPEELRRMMPFDARNHPSYNALFQTIWKELEHLEDNS